MKNILIIGDVHWKSSPNSLFNIGLSKLFDWLVSNYSDWIIIFTGDFFDTPSIHWRVYNKAFNYLKQFNQVIILTGNHDFNWIKGNSILSFSVLDNVQIIDKQTTLELENYNVALFPYLWNVIDMKEYGLYNKDCDFSVSHVSPPGCNFNSLDEIEFKFKASIGHIYGHIHEPKEYENKYGKHYVIGVPQTTRNLEHKFIKYIIEIVDGKLTKKIVPEFFTIEDITYGKEPVNKNNLINVLDAPSVDLVLEKYKEYNIRKEGIRLLRTDANHVDTATEMKGMLDQSLMSKFFSFCLENEIDEEIKTCVKSYL